MHDSNLTVVVEALHAAHRLVPAELRVDLEHVPLFDANRRPVLVVKRVAVRNDGVQAVVAAEPFEDNENFAALIRRDAVACLGQHWWYLAHATEQAEPYAACAEAQHVATRNAGSSQWILGGHEASPPLTSGRSIPRPQWRM